MKKIEKPTETRVKEVVNACGNKKLRATYPKLLKFSLRYERLTCHYDRYGGDPNKVLDARMSDDEVDAVLYLYDKPPKGMPYLKERRDSLAGETCPMCGGFNPTTLDHYLTKKKYPEYALMPFNLIPACSCNSDRQERLYDKATGQRILHPYYDTCLDLELIKININPADEVPKFTVDYMLPAGDVSYENLKFHVQNVVLRTNFLTYISKRWSKIKLLPKLVVPSWAKNISSKAALRAHLSDEAARLSADRGPNSWEAVFFRSISEKHISDWLFDNAGK